MSAAEFRQTEISDIVVTPLDSSGYFQGWNTHFQNKELYIGVSFIISNIGPGSLNNGVSVVIVEKGKSPVFLEAEFNQKQLKYARDTLKIQSYNNYIYYKNGKYIVNAELKKTRVYLEFKPANKGIRISGGKKQIGDADKFVQSDIVFTDSSVNGIFSQQGSRQILQGKGSMEHLLSNYEVYKYSKNWYIIKSLSSDGHSIVSGGFNGNSNYKEGFFKTVALLSPQGKILFASRISKLASSESEYDKIIKYLLPKKEIYNFGSEGSCLLEIKSIAPFSKINILSGISPVLRAIISLFFARPFQIQSKAIANFVCDKLEFNGNGLHSYFLVNP